MIEHTGSTVMSLCSSMPDDSGKWAIATTMAARVKQAGVLTSSE